MVLRDAYETAYGIHDHVHKSDDMALVRRRDAENIEVFDPTTERLIMYHNAGVLKYAGIKFNDFMDLPRHRGETIALACQEVMRLELEEKRKHELKLEEEKKKLLEKR